jgi:UDPglucose 6-dehydrogenase
MKITVIGAGYVGMSTAVMLGKNNSVMIYDIDHQKVKDINNKFYPVINEEVSRYFKEKKFSIQATDEFDNAICDADYIIISVPTNLNFESNCLDTSIIETIVSQIVKMDSKATIVIKSTVPIGFMKNLIKKYSEIRLIYSPEFLCEKSPLYDTLNPNRIIVGIDKNNPILLALTEKYCHLLKEGCRNESIPIILTQYTEAECIKLFSNTYLAMRVAFFNELDSYAENNNLDASAIINGACLDTRIGSFYNNPSFGYGGYCLPKDTKQINQNMKDSYHSLIETINKSNDERCEFVVEQILKRKSQVIGIFRLDIKNYLRDMNNSIMLKIIISIHKYNKKIIVYEPLIDNNHDHYFDIENNLRRFKATSDIILANRYDECLNDVREKVYTRDIYNRD